MKQGQVSLGMLTDVRRPHLHVGSSLDGFPPLGWTLNLPGVLVVAIALSACLEVEFAGPVEDAAKATPTAVLATIMPTYEPMGTPTPASGDRAVLVALYNTTGVQIWHENTNWLSDRSLGEWAGVLVDGNGRVTRLDLSGNRLSGEIPPELGNHSNLVHLNLNSDRLSAMLFARCESARIL